MRLLSGNGILALSALVLLGTASCQPSSRGTSATNSKSPYPGQNVTLFVPKAFNLPAVWEVMIQEWSAQSGASAHFSEFDSNQPIPSQSLPEPGSGGVVALFPLKELCEIESRFAEQSPTPAGGEIDTRDLFKGLKERVLSRERRVIASPISVPVLVCYYRKDLLKAARLKAPETWEDYHQLVSTLDKWAPGLVAVEPLSPEFRATTFAARSIAFCKHPENYSIWFDLDSGKPSLDTPGFEKALETAHKTWSLLAAESQTSSAADCRRLILTGKAAITLTYETGLPPSDQNGSQGAQRIDGVEIGICPLPGSKAVYNRNSKKWDTQSGKTVHAPGLCGFDGLAAGVVLPTDRPTESAAMNLLASLTSPVLFDQAFSSLPKNPCRESQVAQAAAWYGPDLSGDEATQYVDTVAQTLRDTQIVFEFPLAGADEFRKAVSTTLDPLLKGQASSPETLAALQKSFELIVEKRGASSIRESHRRGLGMAPALKE